MPLMRQRSGSEFIIRTVAAGYASGALLPIHSHNSAQLVYATEGVMTVETEDGTWVVPSYRAVWIPPGVSHSILMSGRVEMRTLYLVPELARHMPTRCFVLVVGPLLRELILHTIANRSLRRDVPEHRRLAGVLCDQLRILPAIPLELPLPRDTRAQEVASRLRDEPSDSSSVDTIARRAGASRRTLERIFRKETGMSLGEWRQQARLLHAMRLLAHGAPVTSTALEVGYESTSAFIAAFSRVLGTTPGRYYRQTPEEV
jgi:AraC-like DNA-binding protein